MRIVIDSREQLPFAFQHERYAGTWMETGTLDTGDYSLAGLTGKATKWAARRLTLPCEMR
jgi:hypothetical protein